MTDKTPTPRTDAEDHYRVDVDEAGLTYVDAVRGDFARQLERECAQLRAALVLIAAIDQRRSPHLGPERWSGIEKGCSQCIAAVALGRTGDEATAADFDNARLSALVEPA